MSAKETFSGQLCKIEQRIIEYFRETFGGQRRKWKNLFAEGKYLV